MAKQYKTSGEVRKVFTRIGRVGGNTVKGLIAGGRLFNILWHNNMIDEKAVREAAEEAGINPEDMDIAFAAAEAARDELQRQEESIRDDVASRAKKKTA